MPWGSSKARSGFVDQLERQCLGRGMAMAMAMAILPTNGNCTGAKAVAEVTGASRVKLLSSFPKLGAMRQIFKM